jgi:maltose/moltooligosaccharide transporter
MSLKPRLTFSQIINMNVGFFGIQYSFGLQQSAINPIYDMLGANADQIPMLNLAGPVTGLLVQPLIGAMSDRTWHPRWGRRKPFFLVGAILCSLALLFFPLSGSLWMAAGLLWILDIGNNTAMEPYRAFVADVLPQDQQVTGFQAQSFFTGFGQTLANLSLFIFPIYIVGHTGKLPNWVIASFLLGAVCSIATILWSMHKTPEPVPSNTELEDIKNSNSNKSLIQIFLQSFLDIIAAIKTMPKVLKQLAVVYLFQWYALFCYWQFASKSIANSVFNTTPEADASLYEKAVSWTGLVNAWYNIVTFLCAFALVWVAKKYSPKLTHSACLLVAGIGLLFFPFIQNKYLLFAAITGFGIGWASIMGIPYMMVVNQIPKEKYGVYMGIINMLIVIPMLIQTVTFKFVYNGILSANPCNAVLFAGILLIIASACTMLIKTSEQPKPLTVVK